MRHLTSGLVLLSLAATACGTAQKTEDTSTLSSVTPLAPRVVVDFGSCSEHVANAGQVFQCPGNKFVVGIADRMPNWGRFETIQCCALRTQGSGYRVASVGYSERLESTAYGQERLCSGQRFLKGVGFDSGGGAGTMLCARMHVPALGRNVYKNGYGEAATLYTYGTARCSGHNVGTGLGDNISADGTIDNIRCQPAAY